MKAIDVTIQYLTPVLGINPTDDLGLAYFEEKIKKEIEKIERRMERTTDEKEYEILEARLERLKYALGEAGIEDEDEDIKDRKVKVFLRDKEGNLCWAHHQIKGHLKEIAQYRLSESWLRNGISRFVDVFPHGWDVKKNGIKHEADLIPILRNGKPIKEPDEVISRPLASWVGSQRIVTIVSSEMINLPAELKFRIVIWDTEKKDKIPTPDHIRKILDYGVQWGHSGWRTARYGRYEVKEFNVVEG